MQRSCIHNSTRSHLLEDNCKSKKRIKANRKNNPWLTSNNNSQQVKKFKLTNKKIKCFYLVSDKNNAIK